MPVPDTFVTEMYRFLLRPKWIAFHVLCFGGIALMLWLAMWQLDRLDERKDFNAQVAARSEQPAVSIDELLAEPGFTPDDAAWRVVDRDRHVAAPAGRRVQPLAERASPATTS